MIPSKMGSGGNGGTQFTVALGGRSELMPVQDLPQCQVHCPYAVEVVIFG